MFTLITPEEAASGDFVIWNPRKRAKGEPPKNPPKVINEEGIVQAKDALPQLLAGVSHDDIYSFKEYELYYRETRVTSLWWRKTRGIDIDTMRVVLGLCCNASGSDMVPLFVIGKDKHPACFGEDWDSLRDSGVHYLHNPKKVAMTSVIFQQCLELLAKHVKRKIWLLVSNNPPHNIKKSVGTRETRCGLNVVTVGNVNVVYLPKNTSTRVHPLNMVINSFKHSYSSLLFSFQNPNIGKKKTTKKKSKGKAAKEDEPPVSTEVTLAIAFGWCRAEWRRMRPVFIQHAWKESAILGPGVGSVAALPQASQ